MVRAGGGSLPSKQWKIQDRARPPSSSVHLSGETNRIKGIKKVYTEQE
jgi:hypothetical protein